MLKLHKSIEIESPVEKVFQYIDRPANLPEIWPSLFTVKDVKTLPGGGHRFMWLYNLAGRQVEGTSETYKYVPNEYIADKAWGPLDSTVAWSFKSVNGMTHVEFDAEYETPTEYFDKQLERFFVKRNEYEADVLLSNLKARLEV